MLPPDSSDNAVRHKDATSLRLHDAYSKTAVLVTRKLQLVRKRKSCSAIHRKSAAAIPSWRSTSAACGSWARTSTCSSPVDATLSALQPRWVTSDCNFLQSERCALIGCS